MALCLQRYFSLALCLHVYLKNFLKGQFALQKKQKKNLEYGKQGGNITTLEMSSCSFSDMMRAKYVHFCNHFVANDPSWTCANPFTNIFIGTGINSSFYYMQDIGETGLTMFSIERIQFLKGRCLTEQLVSRAIHINDFYLHSFGDGFFSAL